jgi:lysine-ketoglutarate reductase/saccharopine dehydrogenase-like protein (TIGR00300 family)
MEMRVMREIELEGHLIDSLILPKVFDKIMDMGGDFEVVEFRIGKKKTDTSYARIIVKGESEEHVDKIVSELHRFGARAPEAEEVTLVPAPDDKVVPKNFYSTTNHPTFVRYKGKWIPVENIEMDCLIVIRGDRAFCEPIAHIKKGDLIVVGEKGVRVIPPERPREKSIFHFMGGTVSSERPSMTLVKKIAREMFEIKERGGKIAVVLGPAVVHTGANLKMAEIIRMGFVDVVLGGNAIAVHDIESNLFGTSLGMDIKTGEPVPGGHRHHLYSISEIIAHGGIKKAVEKGVITAGIMYECVKNDVKFVLAGSIRDDGPLPEVITDTMIAQDKMAEALKDVDMVLMMATMLHSIAVGNLLPSYVKTVCVDINPATVTKLVDRGTAQAIGIVTDVGVFIPALAEELRKLKEKRRSES